MNALSLLAFKSADLRILDFVLCKLIHNQEIEKCEAEKY